MFMGALLDAGVSPKLLEDAVSALNLGARLEIAKVTKGGLAATKADVWVAGEKDKPLDEYWAEHEHDEHSHEHGHGHSHEHRHDLDMPLRIKSADRNVRTTSAIITSMCMDVG